MGLIRAAFSSTRSTLKDQYLDFITLSDVSDKILMKRGYFKANANHGNANVITNGSKIVVPQGFAMALIDQGKVVEFCAEPGEFIFDSGTEPSVFNGGLKGNLRASFEQWKERVKFGSEIAKDMRVYYINLREITGNKFGTPSPIPFDDPKYQTIYLRYFGMFSLHVSDPIRLLENLLGVAAKDVIYVEDYISQLKAEFISALTQSMSKFAYEHNISFNKLPMYQDDLSTYMNTCKDEAWNALRGFEVIAVGIESISVSDESKDRIKEYDDRYFAEQHAQGTIISATAESMKLAAANEGGNAGMFMGMGVGGMMSQAMQSGAAISTAAAQSQTVQPITNASQMNAETTWTCNCGSQNTGNFCPKCGAKKQDEEVFCSNCGTKSNGNFCSGCGMKLK